MAAKKPGPGSLADRIRAVTGKAIKSPTGLGAALGQGPVRAGHGKRKSDRKEAFKQGELISPTGERVQIVLKNISETGARVDFFSGGTSIFGRAELLVPTLGLKRRVRIVWKDQNSAGLEFELD